MIENIYTEKSKDGLMLVEISDGDDMRLYMMGEDDTAWLIPRYDWTDFEQGWIETVYQKAQVEFSKYSDKI